MNKNQSVGKKSRLNIILKSVVAGFVIALGTQFAIVIALIYIVFPPETTASPCTQELCVSRYGDSMWAVFVGWPFSMVHMDFLLALAANTFFYTLVIYLVMKVVKHIRRAR